LSPPERHALGGIFFERMPKG